MPEHKPQIPIPNRLKGLVALITGAAGNIGLEAASRLLHEGASVVLVDINAEKLAQSKRKLIDDFKESPMYTDQFMVDDAIFTVQADVTVEEDVLKSVTKAVSKFGRLNIAVLCAGISYSSTNILETDIEQYDKVMRVNSRSGVRHCRNAMKQTGSGGSIILVSSIAGLRATPGLSVYSMSKFALRGLCLSAAAELEQFNIRVNTVHPSGVNTPMFLASWPPEKMESMLASVPLDRWAEVADVAALVAFLGSSDAQFMTAGALKVDGGVVMY
ncbi:hypothetical protein PENARI_c035G02433 [Penicillium arizonense]|uniref:Uncharacterized protein n=1 Tax=Penicillium arizonense TaxID=1835702 RepID=A0A1F5L4F0_PENAI|nr:hypothetical protein PENARI_c035G02433 [Penicillium arizonense]OGE47850.1 hypothetical protein PENARI_c035G02433 [Penicillium arizonense]